MGSIHHTSYIFSKILNVFECVYDVLQTATHISKKIQWLKILAFSIKISVTDIFMKVPRSHYKA